MNSIKNPEDIKNILVIRMNKIGDMICTIPLIKTLRRNFKNAKIAVFTEELSGELLKDTGLADGIIIYKKNSKLLWNKYLECWRLMTKYKKEYGIKHFDMAIAVKGGFSSFLSIITFLSGAHIRVGYLHPKNRFLKLFYNFPVKPIDIPKFHQVDACLNLLTVVGIKEQVKDIAITIPAEHKATAVKFLLKKGLQPKKQLAIFNISNNRNTSTWQTDNFIKLGRMLSQKYGYNCIITCVSVDKEKAFKICSELKGNGFFYDTPKLMDFAAITSLANLLVAGDGGAIHIGAAVGTKVIALFGQTNPIIYGPYGEGHIILKSYKGNINSITPDDVIKVAKINE